MNSEEMFSAWAPDDAQWSPWAKPVIFVNLAGDILFQSANLWKDLDVSWVPSPGEKTVLVVDIPGAMSVGYGVTLAKRGFRPVPLYNTSNGPFAVVNLTSIMDAITEATAEIRTLSLPNDAPPVFLIDANRLQGFPAPKNFDNRWMLFPQDFPSGNLLMSQGFSRVIVIQDREGQPREDLAHILLRWQETGIQILVKNSSSQSSPTVIKIQKPSKYKSLWYLALAILGLRRSSAGGFGAIVPDATQSSGWG